MPEPTVPCMYCGKPTPFEGTKKCTNCWEVVSRLTDFLQSERGREYAENELKIAQQKHAKEIQS